MCVFNLTTISRCGHEVPTINYCYHAEPAVQAYEQAQRIGRPVKPPMTCTDSLGWQLHKSFKAPVVCPDCIGWLSKEGKRTYGGVKERRRVKRGRGKRVKFELPEEIKVEDHSSDGYGSGTESQDADAEEGKHDGDEAAAGNQSRGLALPPPAMLLPRFFHRAPMGSLYRRR